MGSKHYQDDWSRLRTHTLLGLFQTHAPPDFRSRVLERAHELQRARLQHESQAQSAPGRWAAYRIWLRYPSQRHPRRLPLVLGLSSACALLLSVSLAWWGSQPRASLWSAPDANEHLASVLQPDEPAVVALENVSEAPGDPVPAPSLTMPAEHTASLGCPTLAPPSESESLETMRPSGEPAEAAILPSAPPLLRTAQESSSALQTPAPRSDHKRAVSGKSKRARKNHGVGRHTPA